MGLQADPRRDRHHGHRHRRLERLGDPEASRCRTVTAAIGTNLGGVPLHTGERADGLRPSGANASTGSHALVPISSLLGDVLEAAGTDLGEFGDLKPFEVAVLHPGRTLLEKLVLIHALAQQLAAGAGGSIDRRSGRHFYDVYQLLGDRQVFDLLADRDQTEQVMRSVEEINRAFFGDDGIEVRPAGGIATCPAFDPTSDISTRLRAGYESTRSGPAPSVTCCS